MQRKQPAMILTSKFTPSYGGQKFGKYLGYMARKEALESKEYLTDDEQKELNQITIEARKLDVHGKFRKVYESDKDTQPRKEAKKYLNEEYFSELTNEQFGKYLGYMDRIDALASKKEDGGLTVKEQKEYARVTKAAEKLSDLRPTKDKVALGTFTCDMDTVRLEDFQHIRDKLNEGQANGSVMWQDVISFDNNFLDEHGILNKTTGELNEDALRKATKKMMSTFAEKMDPPLYHPYWSASIHRNTDNIHIHIATVEKESHREVIKRPKMVRDKKTGELVKTDDYVFQTKGRRPQSVIDQMKFSFANELINTTEMTKQISRQRDVVKENVVQTIKSKITNPEFQNNLNRFVERLPESRRDWNYSYFEKFDKEGKKQLDELTDYIVKDDPDYKEFVKEVNDFQKNRQELFGISKRSTKNYAKNKLADLKRRNGNTLLHQISGLDKQANYYRRKLPTIRQQTDPNKYIQEVLNELKNQQKKRQQINNSRVIADENRANRQRKQRRKNIKPTINKAKLKKMEKEMRIKSKKELVREKAQMSYDTRKAMNEYERIQREVQRSRSE